MIPPIIIKNERGHDNISDSHFDNGNEPFNVLSTVADTGRQIPWKAVPPTD